MSYFLYMAYIIQEELKKILIAPTQAPLAG